MYKVSVVVPIHNMEQYLRESLESVERQTIGFENIQVILVNDGSTDKSKEIMDEYASKYSNVCCLHFEEKSGAAGKPRNEGIKLVEAPYTMFLDPDDLYEEHAIERLYNTIVKENVDIVTANYRYMEEDGRFWEKSVFDGERFKNFAFSEENFSDSFFVWNSACWNKIFSTKLVKENNLYFLEGVPAEDAFFTYAALLASKSAYYLSETTNFYRRRSNTGTLSVSWDRSLKYFKNINFAYRKIYELFRDADKMSLFRYFYSKTLTSVFYKVVDTTIMTEEEKKIALEEMKWFFEIRKEVDIGPCQSSLEFVFEKIENEEYDDAVKCCNIIAEMRRYIQKDVREGMSKPEFVNYVEL